MGTWDDSETVLGRTLRNYSTVEVTLTPYSCSSATVSQAKRSVRSIHVHVVRGLYRVTEDRLAKA